MTWDEPDDRGPLAETEPAEDEVGHAVSPGTIVAIAVVLIVAVLLLAWLT